MVKNSKRVCALSLFFEYLIIKTLNLVRGNQLKAAELLGINRNTLRKKIIYLDIQLGSNGAKN